MNDREQLNELISAALDKELPPRDEERLETWLQDDPDARLLAEEFEALQQDLGQVQPVTPPTSVRDAILKQLQSREDNKPLSKRIADSLSGLFGMQYMRYAGSFVAGAVLMLAIATTDNVSRVGAGNTTQLVGTIGATDQEAHITHGTVIVNDSDIRAAITLRSREALVVLDIDFESGSAVDLVATFDTTQISFRGIEQPPGTPANLVSAPGRVKIRLTSQGRYAVYMENTATAAATIGLSVDSAGTTIHEEDLILEIND